MDFYNKPIEEVLEKTRTSFNGLTDEERKKDY